jgi:transcriptional regulator with XRE-family HTH domain
MRAGKNIVGPQMRRIRFERGLSQPALAAVCQRQGWDVGRDTIAKIEAGNRWVGDFELLFLARALDVRMERLFSPAVLKVPKRKDLGGA